MAIEKIALDNVKRVVENEPVEVAAHVDIGTAAAYEESIEAAEHVDEVNTELAKTAESVVTDSPETPKVKEDSIYTKKLKLDESIEEFNFADIDGSKDDDDRYVDFDMFDFIYS